MELFKSVKVTDRITRIEMPYVCAYLIEGDDKAILLDTGFGYGDLKAFVDTLTTLPYEVILTHGHPDHAGGRLCNGSQPGWWRFQYLCCQGSRRNGTERCQQAFRRYFP